MNKLMGVYRFFNTKTLKGYVGSSRDIHTRQRGHINKLNRGKHHSFLLQRSWNKQQYWINHFDAANPEKGYNRCPIAGTTKDLIPTPETIERLRTSHLGYKPSPETIEKQRMAMLGKKYPYKARPWRLRQETRICSCGCGESFTTVKNDPKRFLNRQHKEKAAMKPRETRTCLCGCGEVFTVITTSPKRYVLHHANFGRKKI
jgi:hypothetical protein